MNSFHHRAKRFGVIFSPSRVGSSPLANHRLRAIRSSLLTLTFSAGRAACGLKRSGAIRVPEPFVRTTLSPQGSLKEVEDILWSLASRRRALIKRNDHDWVPINNGLSGTRRPHLRHENSRQSHRGLSETLFT